MIDPELKELFTKIAELQASSEERLARLDVSMARTDAQLAKTDAQLAKTDAQLAKTDAQLAKTDAQLAETNAQLARTDAKLNRLAEMYGGISNNQGKVAEDFFFNSLKHKPIVNGIPFDYIDKNTHRFKNGIEEEYDILLVNGKDVMIVEVKYSLHANDIIRVLDKKIPNFTKLFPEYKNYRTHIAFASFSLSEDVKQLALQKGVLLLQRRGEVFETLVA